MTALSLLDRAAVIARVAEHVPDDLNVSASLWADRAEIGIHADRIHATRIAHALNLQQTRTSPGLTTTWEGTVTLHDETGQPRKTVTLHVVHYPAKTAGRAA